MIKTNSPVCATPTAGNASLDFPSGKRDPLDSGRGVKRKQSQKLLKKLIFWLARLDFFKFYSFFFFFGFYQSVAFTHSWPAKLAGGLSLRSSVPGSSGTRSFSSKAGGGRGGGGVQAADARQPRGCPTAADCGGDTSSLLIQQHRARALDRAPGG